MVPEAAVAASASVARALRDTNNGSCSACQRCRSVAGSCGQAVAGTGNIASASGNNCKQAQAVTGARRSKHEFLHSFCGVVTEA